MVNVLTKGTTAREMAMAQTPISGDLAAAAEKPECKEIKRVALPTVIKPERIPEKAPTLVIFLEKSPQMYGPIKQPETTPQEKDIKLTMMGMFCVAKMKEQATKPRQKSLVSSIWESGAAAFLVMVGIKSTATVEAEVRTTA